MTISLAAYSRRKSPNRRTRVVASQKFGDNIRNSKKRVRITADFSSTENSKKHAPVYSVACFQFKMSARKISESREIPSRRITVHDPAHLPNDFSTTPGGTIFSTTPGGTRIIYDRAFLLQMRNSPVAKTPPKNLPQIPGVTSPQKVADKSKENIASSPVKNNKDKPDANDEPQFEMDI